MNLLNAIVDLLNFTRSRSCTLDLSPKVMNTEKIKIVRVLLFASALILSNKLDTVGAGENEITAPTTSINSYNNRTQMYLERADEDIVQKKYTSALSRLNACIDNDQNYKYLCMKRKAEILCFNMHKNSEGIKLFDKLIDDLESAKDDDLLLNLSYEKRGDCFLKDGFYESALKDYDKSCTISNVFNNKDTCSKKIKLKRLINRPKKWQFLTKTEDTELYYDRSSLQKVSKHNIKFWVRSEYSIELAQANHIDFSLELIHMDCMKRIINTESLIQYDIDGTVKSSEHYGSNGRKEAVVPDTLGEHIYNIMCTKTAGGKNLFK